VCALRKYTKTVFPSSDNRSVGVLDLIPIDVCGPCLEFPWVVGSIMLLSLMTTLGRILRVRYLRGSKSSNLSWRTRQERRSRFYGQTMEVSIPPQSLQIYVLNRV
jgi:hypothetical protein